MSPFPRSRSSLLGVVAGVGAIGAATLAVRRRRVSERIRDYTTNVQRNAVPVDADLYERSDVEDLPAPVRRYFETVLRDGQPHVTQVRLTQTGQFRLGGADAAWHPLTASQIYSVSPPGYVWDADIELSPLVSARVLDAYVDGEGLLRANLLGAIPVASAGPNRQMSEAELQRYLSETPWFPTALLPAAGVSWEGIDDRTARASIADGDVTATGVFHFDEAGYLRRLTADRYRQDVDAVAPWVGQYMGYEGRDGMEIPTAAEVGWERADGTVPYWRGQITEIEYRTG
ncbi:DUF6920 family protein [Halapricum hydrolyticum]|uniref:Uncharacterized protein n=1 Tax=Halapricum hydrolyticum TaxID=2979991 RepID=A0AAE3LFW4_9EURY|nr:DUF6544 family protein [Halapricum hydrolyticum]MCU4719021.1 hypothetical protein [Halapricum hydrolyticum]MCU4728010.1 hypothetical protein [Halapricum hydrolyticum]